MTKADPPSATGRDHATELDTVPVDLGRWDRSGGGDLLAVFIWSDVRPLRGAAGLLDWRLSGRLSSLIRSGRLTGAEDEQLLLPTGGRLAWTNAMVMGLGSRTGFAANRYRAAVRRALATLQRLGVHDVAMAPPGRDIEALPSGRAVEMLLSEIRAHAEWLWHLTVVEQAQGGRGAGGPALPRAHPTSEAARRG